MNNLMLRNYIKLCLHENLAGDSLGKAADLEEAIIAAAKGVKMQWLFLKYKWQN